MDIRSIPRKILNTQLRLARAPFDRVLGQNPMVDAAEAAIRDTAGTVLRDDTLRQDAALQRAKAEQLKEAARLAAEAERTRRQAEAEYAQDVEQAQREAEQRQAEIEQERQAKTRQVREETARKKATTQKVAQARQERIREEEAKAQLQAAAAEAEALDAKQEELAIREEANRLADAAKSVRTRRKT